MSGVQTKGPVARATEGELRFLAAKIATSYARANTLAPTELPAVIRIAYSGLLTCTEPVPVPPEKGPKGKGRKQLMKKRR